jgi:hypothetical protein
MWRGRGRDRGSGRERWRRSETDTGPRWHRRLELWSL